MTELPSLAVAERVHALLSRHSAILAHSGWQQVRQPPGIEAAILQTTAPIAFVHCTTTLAVAAPELARYLIDDILTTLGEWNPLYLNGRVLQHTAQARLLHLRFRGPTPLVAPRDNLIAVTRIDRPDGTILELSEDDQHAALPPERGMVRMILPFAAKQITPINATRCRYSVIWQTDPAGLLSRLLPEPFLIRAVLNDLIGELGRLRTRFG